MRPERLDRIWSRVFVEHRTHNARNYRMLNVIDEFTRECLAIRPSHKLKALDGIDVFSAQMMPIDLVSITMID